MSLSAERGGRVSGLDLRRALIGQAGPDRSGAARPSEPSVAPPAPAALEAPSAPEAPERPAEAIQPPKTVPEDLQKDEPAEAGVEAERAAFGPEFFAAIEKTLPPAASRADRRPASPPVLAFALAGMLVCLAIGLPKLVAVWTTGRFFDPDDAMRLTQLRDLINGQGWSDLAQTRLNAPDGLLMHWSRVIDLPLAAAISLFEVLSTQTVAERLVRIVWPATLHVGFFIALIQAVRLANGGRGAIAALFFGIGMAATNGQFEPGRIDHHGPQILLLVGMAATALAALDDQRARLGALSGALAALSLSISVENLPFIATLGLALGLFMACAPQRYGAVACWFALGLAGAALPLLAATTPDGQAFREACDAFSIVHLVMILAGAALVAGLALVLPLAGPLAARAGLAAAAGAGALLLIHQAFPACFGDPLARVDPLLRSLWLGNVAEARPLLALTFKRPDLGLPLAMPMALGLCGALIATWMAKDVARTRWALVAMLIGAGFAAALWQVRASSSTLPLAAIPAVWLFLTAADRVANHRPLAHLMPVAAILPFSSLFWMALLPEPVRAGLAPAAQASCSDPAGFEALATLPKTIVLATIDSGSDILAHTHHAVLAGPYHRNNQGNLLAVNALLATPERAQAMMRASGASLVAICPQMVDLGLYAERAPNGLAALLRRGERPDWLAPVVAGESPWRIYRLR